MKKTTQNRLIRMTFAALMSIAAISPSAYAITPAGAWTLAQPSPNVKDYFFKIEVDPGEEYPDAEAIPGGGGGEVTIVGAAQTKAVSATKQTLPSAANVTKATIDLVVPEGGGDPATAPSSVYWAQYIVFENGLGGYLGLQRVGGKKLALVSIWDGLDSVGNKIPRKDCYEDGPCSSIGGEYDWKVGHQYRFRMERSLRRATGWWQVSLADLTTGTVDILGEMQTPTSWGGLANYNDLFLEYFQGPFACQALRHARASFAPIRGNWGQNTALKTFSGESYGEPDVCDTANLLPGMVAADYSSSSSAASDGTVTTIGNKYRGLLKWGQFNKTAKAGMMFASNPDANYPEVFRALKDGQYGNFPTNGQANADWQAIGKGYPVINDLYLRNQRLKTWDERNLATSAIGDFFVYDNPYTGDVEYFKLQRKPAWYYPIDKSSNADWLYVGRHWKNGEKLPNLTIHQWGENNRRGRVGSVFQYGKMYFRLKTASQYWYFPTTPTDNAYWEFLGLNP